MTMKGKLTDSKRSLARRPSQGWFQTSFRVPNLRKGRLILPNPCANHPGSSVPPDDPRVRPISTIPIGPMMAAMTKNTVSSPCKNLLNSRRKPENFKGSLHLVALKGEVAVGSPLGDHNPESLRGRGRILPSNDQCISISSRGVLFDAKPLDSA